MSLHAIQSQYWAVRDYLSPVLRESKFKEHGRITPEEFVAAGDFLTYKFPLWTWEKGEPSKARDFLPPEKQYLMTRAVPCPRRATSLAYTDADEDAEKMLSFAEEGTDDKEEEWVQTHSGRKPSEAAHIGDIDDIPDFDGPASGLPAAMNKLDINASPHIDDIPDMEEEGLEEEDEDAKGNLLQVRTYDVMITYDKYYQTPRIWLLGYDEARNPLTPSQVFQDVSADHAFKTVTIDPFPHSSKLRVASVHPCKHADVMKKVIERMNAGVIDEQKANTPGKGADGKKRWFGGVVRKVTGGGNSSTPAADQNNNGSSEGMRVDMYLVVFLKFIASIVPTIEVDSTTAL
ncbi:autophagocytosis associated protein [Cantharellus anzutake]|uniref:autophagocytosis associated protein n=1 Tax=Cantharellus anzutake TaxID=1750568 RepID=UPI001907C439|nr:autophagocytosis associated protein [Cantharellus anzutake]KAF8342334.1 autophagocytosis associated protein [Cantharellus anzutake]